MRAAFVPHRRERKMCNDISWEPPVSSKQSEKTGCISVTTLMFLFLRFKA